MINKNLFIAATAALTLASSAAFAAPNMEKCKVVKDGVGLIKEGKADCGNGTHSCAGNNKANDPESWILVPAGECDKINAGDLSGVSDEIKEKLDITE